MFLEFSQSSVASEGQVEPGQCISWYDNNYQMMCGGRKTEEKTNIAKNEEKKKKSFLSKMNVGVSYQQHSAAAKFLGNIQLNKIKLFLGKYIIFESRAI